jgi:sugar lactone lactonase YvrE
MTRSSTRQRLIVTGMSFVFWAATTSAASADSDYLIEHVLPASPIHGANGMEFDAEGKLIVSTMAGAEIYRINVTTGESETLVAAPHGLGDGLAVGPDGTVAWTALPAGEVRALRPNGEIVVLASGIERVNSIKFAKDGRLYAAQVSAGDSLYEIDIAGEKPARLIAQGMDCPADLLCGLNSFDITDGNVLYGPLMAKGTIVKIDLSTGVVAEVAQGFEQPTGARFDSLGNLYVLNWRTGELIRLEVDTGNKSVIATLPPPLDNLTVGPGDLIYVSNPVENVIHEIDPRTGRIRTLLQGGLVMPGGLAIMTQDGQEVLIVSGVFRPSQIDIETGDIRPLTRSDQFQSSFTIDSNETTIAIAEYRSGTVKLLERGSGRELEVYDGFDSPYDVRILSDESLIIADYGAGSLIHIDSDGKRRVLVDTLNGPLGLAVVDDSSVYVTEVQAGVVSHISLPMGTRTVVATDLNQPEGIALLADGRLAVADVGAKRVVLIDPLTGETETIAGDLPIGAAPFAALGLTGQVGPFLPTGIAVSKSDDIYITSDVDHTVLRLKRR